jgi:membrane-associated protease RseP (regulator of RpoE activity)
MDSYANDAQLETILKREMQIRDITSGGEKQGYFMRYRGQLRDLDTGAAYDRLETALFPLGIQPLFRWDGEQHTVLLVKSPPAPKPSNPRINLWFFLATLVSVYITGAQSVLAAPPAGGTLALLWAILREGAPYTLAILAILTAHEFGHYFAARYHKVNVSLPYLLPLPLISPFGTMGAFISMKEQPKNRRHLLDIGLAGPLAGVAVTLPILIIGLILSPVQPLPAAPAQEDPIAFLRGNPAVYFLADVFVPGKAPAGETLNLILEGNSTLYLAVKYIVHGQMLPAPASYGSMPVPLYWLRYFFTGQPLPFGGVDVQLHPLAWAGWFGLLITGLNLIPAGQLDGGHAIYVLLGRERARKVARVVFYLALVLGILSINWWLWAALIRALGRVYAEPRDEITPLDPGRKAVAILGIVLFFLVFTPVPLTGF